MADNETRPAGSIFNKKAAEKLKSPEPLDKYVRVTNPSMWAVLIAALLLAAGLLSWAFFGSITTNITAKGTYLKDGRVVCFLSYDQASQVTYGDKANVGGEQMTVAGFSALPISRSEAKEALESEFLATSLVPQDWMYAVQFEGDGDYSFDTGYPISITITTESISPATFLWENMFGVEY